MSLEISPESDNQAQAQAQAQGFDRDVTPITIASLGPGPDLTANLGDVAHHRGEHRPDQRPDQRPTGRIDRPGPPRGDRTPPVHPANHHPHPHAGRHERRVIPGGHQQYPPQGFDQRFRRQNYTSNQIDQQRLEQIMRRRQQQQQFGNFYGSQQMDRQAYYRQQMLRQQQMARYQQSYPRFQQANYGDNWMPWQQGNQYMSGPWGNHWENGYDNYYHRHRHRHRSGPDFSQIFGLLAGTIATGAIIDQVSRRAERTQSPSDQVAAPTDTRAREGRDRQRSDSNDRSEPFTAKSRPDREGWMQEHGRLIERAANNRGQTVIYGDGNTRNLQDNQNFRTLGWQQFGIAMDGSEHLLWRLRNGEANFNRDTPPQQAVLMIGTNNIGRASTEDIVRGIMENHKELRTRLPNARIAVVGVLPKGNDQQNNQQIVEVNRRLQEQLRDKPNTVFVDARSVLTRNNERIPEMWQPAGIHLSTQGQNTLLEHINQRLRRTS